MHGARSLLVSLWEVDDAATAILMSRFYENMMGAYVDERAGGVGRPMPQAFALQEAKRWLREQRDPDGNRPYEHPAYWAPFILIGDTGILGTADP